jgi:uncharacterized membrane protein (DUF4010 family)
MITPESLIGFITAAALGFLVGIERAFNVKGGFAGTRTFILISFLGALAYFFSEILDNWLIFIAVLAGLFIIVIVSYYISAKKGFFGITTEITAFITFILGALAMNEQYQNYAIILVVSMIVILALKEKFRGFVKQTTRVELFDTIKFLIIAFVILPILPDQPLNQFLSEQPLFQILPNIVQQMFGAINLHDVWLLIVLYAGSGFLGYFLIKLFGEKWGLYLNGFLGGFTSATAVNASLIEFSQKSKSKKITLPLVATMVLSNLSMLIRALILVSFVSYALTQEIMAPIFILLLANILFFAVLYFKCSQIEKFTIKVDNPLNLTQALSFGGIFILIIIASQLALTYLGNTGLYLVGMLSSPFQTTGYILNVAKLFDSAQLALLISYIAVATVLVSGMVSRGMENFYKTKNRFGQISLFYYIASALVVIASFWIFG